MAQATRENLREFFREKHATLNSDRTNWQAKKNSWIKAVKEFYRQIQKYLAAAIKDGSVAIAFQPKILNEDFVGDYEVDELVLVVGNERVIFSPKGMNIVGGKGRIDLRGDMGVMTIIRESAGHWNIVATRVPERRIVPLNEETLLTALKSVMQQ